MELFYMPRNEYVFAIATEFHKRVEVFDLPIKDGSTPLSLIAGASRFGIILIGSIGEKKHALRVLDVDDLDAGVGTNFPHQSYPLPHPPTNISVNCSQELLCIITKDSVSDSTFVTIYHTSSCVSSKALSVYCKIRVCPSKINVNQVQWSPVETETFSICTSDGAIYICVCKNNTINMKTKLSEVTCLSWSPQGDTIFTGNADGTLIEYNLNLVLKKTIPTPPIFGEGNPPDVIGVHCLTDDQIYAYYQDVEDTNYSPCTAIINIPEAGSMQLIKYYDTCYHDTRINITRPFQCYITHIPSWGIILAGSANSGRLSMLGTKNQILYQYWYQNPNQSPMIRNPNKRERGQYPIGFIFYDPSIKNPPQDKTAASTYSAKLFILGNKGTLFSYNMTNRLHLYPAPDSDPLRPFTPPETDFTTWVHRLRPRPGAIDKLKNVPPSQRKRHYKK